MYIHAIGLLHHHTDDFAFDRLRAVSQLGIRGEPIPNVDLDVLVYNSPLDVNDVTRNWS